MKTAATFALAAAAASLVVLAAAPPAAAQITVPATSNIYGSGHSVPPAPGGGGGGTLPPLVDIPDGTDRVVRFDSVSGTIDFGPCCPPSGPDGTAVSGAFPAPIWDGIAGTDFATRGRFFAAVFLDDTEPMDPAPDRLVFDDAGFETLAPGLWQVFFLGDGLTGEGSGDLQTFEIPDAATRLFFGFQDRFSSDPNVPGYYGDNTGSVTLTPVFGSATPAPEPGVGAAPWAMIKASYR